MADREPQLATSQESQAAVAQDALQAEHRRPQVEAAAAARLTSLTGGKENSAGLSDPDSRALAGKCLGGQILLSGSNLLPRPCEVSRLASLGDSQVDDR